LVLVLAPHLIFGLHILDLLDHLFGLLDHLLRLLLDDLLGLFSMISSAFMPSTTGAQFSKLARPRSEAFSTTCARVKLAR
jgi:hypothetical protein